MSVTDTHRNVYYEYRLGVLQEQHYSLESVKRSKANNGLWICTRQPTI